MVKFGVPDLRLGIAIQNNIGEARRSYGIRIGREITQDAAAEMFGVSPSGYKKWEQGIGKLNGEILCAIADKYGCSTDYLLCRTDDPTPYPASMQEIASNPEEERLVSAYRRCTKRERMAVLNTAETMADDGAAKNMDNEQVAKAIGA